MMVACNYDYNSSSIPIIAQELSGHRVAVGCCLTHEIESGCLDFHTASPLVEHISKQGVGDGMVAVDHSIEQLACLVVIGVGVVLKQQMGKIAGSLGKIGRHAAFAFAALFLQSHVSLVIIACRIFVYSPIVGVIIQLPSQ